MLSRYLVLVNNLREQQRAKRELQENHSLGDATMHAAPDNAPQFEHDDGAVNGSTKTLEK